MASFLDAFACPTYCKSAAFKTYFCRPRIVLVPLAVFTLALHYCRK